MCCATAPAAFTAAVEADPTRPLITWYDDHTGERVELSGASLANWVAKTANLLVDGCGLGHGDLAVVDLPPHWQTAAVLLGCWSAGLWVADPPAAAGAVAEVGFVGADRWSARPGADPADRSYAETYCLEFAPLGAPMRQVPPGCADFIAAVRGYGDQFRPVEPVSPDDPAIRWLDPPRADPPPADPPPAGPPPAGPPPAGPPPGTVSHRELCRRAADRAAEWGIDANGRVLIEVVAHPDPLDWLLAPLVVGASAVLCDRLDPAGLPQRITAERVTTALTAGRR